MPDKPSSPSLQSENSLAAARRTNLDAPLSEPRIEYPSELPICRYRDELIELIRKHPAIVVCGETGSGKSTQLPKLCWEAGLGRRGMIGHTQPRRLAARSVAARLAEETESALGSFVGYQIRFGDQTGDQTRIKLMTDGILLAETQSDRSLEAYDAIIIDEAHERSLNIDFLLGYLKRLQSKRPELKVIITSATIDAQRFADHFGDGDQSAPIIRVEGRGYPVEIKYLPWEEVTDDEDRGYDLADHVIRGIDEASHHEAGDALVFLPTERDIREVSHRVAGHYKRRGAEQRVDLLPLYARLPSKEQQKIFHPDGRRRRIIFATNVAESSLTVPGIRCVIDAGTARISRYSARTKIQRLPIESISRASADQRAGRCGRVGPGVCVRLYSLTDFDGRDAYTTPEIRRTNLAAVILKMKTLRLGSLEKFPLLDPPRPEAIREGMRTLIELGAIDDRHELTEIGWRLGRMPVDPRVGRIILAADEYGVLPEVLPIAAALEIQDPRDRPPDRRQAADEAHAMFVDPNSDFLSYLRLWRYYEQARHDFSRNKLSRVLRKQFLSPHRLREWSDVYRQLRELAPKNRIGKIRFETDDKKLVSDDRYAAIHQALLTGLLSGIAQLGDRNQYTGAGGLKLFLWPGSGLFESKPKWVVAAELVETAKQYARTVARVQPSWIEKVGQHLLKRSHRDPHWSQKSNGSFCYEQGTLFGLPVYTRRRVPLGPIDPVTARDLLIDRGLAENELKTTARFVHQNRELLDSIAALAAKSRRREFVVDSFMVSRFYQSRLPGDVYDRARLEKLDKSATAERENLLMQWEDLVDTPTQSVNAEAFPDELAVGKSRFPLQYHFEPGDQRDGIGVRVHQATLAQLSDDRLDWLVPGLLQAKLTAMIKSLPKRIRRNLVPAADVATQIADELQPVFGRQPFLSTVCESMSRHAEMPVTPDDFQFEKMAEYFRFLVNVVDDDGKIIATGREVTPLKQQLGSTAGEPMVDESDDDWRRKSTTEFDLEHLPREVVRSRGGVQVAQYPGLVDDGDGVSTRLFADLATAEAALRQGTSRLFSIATRKQLRGQVRWLPDLEQAKIKLSGVVSASDMEHALIHLLARIAFVEGEPVVRSRAEFDRRCADQTKRIAEATQEVAVWLTELAESYFVVRSGRESMGKSSRLARAINDIQHQLDWLFADHFLAITPWQWLQHYPRYLRGIDYRIDKLRSGGGDRDAQSTREIEQLWNRWLATLPEAERSATRQSESEFRWMIEELRVSMFAQALGTSIKVSVKRCEKLLARSAP